MQEALVDSNVLFAFRSSRDQYHDRANAIVEAMDDGNLPRGQVTNYTLPEVLNPLSKAAGHDAAVATVEFLTGSRGFRLQHLAQDDFERGRALFQRRDGVEITDAILVAYMRRTDTEYIYSFDDDFDRFDEVVRLQTAQNPFV
jgi:predicted nucleic acid-binding protein